MHKVIVDLCYGDCGKGKVESTFLDKFNVFVKSNGGPNSGRTVELDGKRFTFRILSAGLLNPNAICVIGNGALINLHVLKEEIDFLTSVGVDVDGRIKISGQAHLLLEKHIQQDIEEEANRASPIGTTKSGIGPCVQDKVRRSGTRVHDIFYLDELKEHRDFIKQYYVNNVPELLREYKNNGASILHVVAHGCYLDIDHGNYPFVTSSNCIASQAWTGSGLPIFDATVVGVFKAYTTRVGEGPFPTELKGSVADVIRAKGNEFGSVTKRPRRTGWLDLPMLKQAIMLNGCKELFMTKIDALDGLDEVKLCVGFKYRDGISPYIYETDTKMIETYEPLLEVFEGWDKTAGITKWNKLPMAAKKYIQFIGDNLGQCINYIGTGADANHYIED